MVVEDSNAAAAADSRGSMTPGREMEEEVDDPMRRRLGFTAAAEDPTRRRLHLPAVAVAEQSGAIMSGGEVEEERVCC